MNSLERAGSRRRVVILGSTGSIGVSALKVIDALPDRLEAFGLSGHSRWKELIEQAFQHAPRYVAVTDLNACRAMLGQTIFACSVR